MNSQSESADVALISPPQWSPFQPALALPSLAAWVARAGFRSTLYDLNLEFYEWLFSKDAVTLLTEQLEHADLTAEERKAAECVFHNSGAFRDSVFELRKWQGTPVEEKKVSFQSIFSDTYNSSFSLETYLRYVSLVSKSFSITPYSFALRAGNMSTVAIDTFLRSPPPILTRFVSDHTERILSSDHPRMVGISCIGQEQLVFSLLIGRQVKLLRKCPVIIGGTILSRMLDRDALPKEWFGLYFDIIARHEGERPLTALLQMRTFEQAQLADVAGIAFNGEHGIVKTHPAQPLIPNETPIPLYDGLPLTRYIASELTLSLLASRGCYWGKCEFCHHGMVYGEKYSSYSVDAVVSTIDLLKARYGVRNFSFNDEAIPPKILDRLSRQLNQRRSEGLFFTGLIKFEPYYDEQVFQAAHAAGFRLLYVGLESASERVLALMRKNTKKSVMSSNLRDATSAGIWMHCFVFFGFPGETRVEALETIEFLMMNQDKIGSFGAGTFSLENNAPISKHPEKFGVNIKSLPSKSVDVYFDYEIDDGVGQLEALEILDLLRERASAVQKYASTYWIPREHYLELLVAGGMSGVVESSICLVSSKGVPHTWTLRQLAISKGGDEGVIVVNRLNGVAIELRGTLMEAYRLLEDRSTRLCDLGGAWPQLLAALAATVRNSSSLEYETRPI